uniref:Nuclear transcription factor Y subunit C-2 n=2 Tax=Cajanus cajan TaxID=3821 RepID=A0A151U0K8_CAJCA|nr:Nuclear transcription factor Y subunit C-2 [Cajanus cajan]
MEATNPPPQATNTCIPPPYPIQQQYAPHYMYDPQEDHLQHQLNNCWARLCQEIEETTDFNTHSLPLDKIEKIMKDDGDVHMVSAEAPVLFAKACELLIHELTMKAWVNADKSKRDLIQKCDIEAAITNTDEFDFLADVVPIEHVGISRRDIDPTQIVPYYYMPPHQHVIGPPFDAP